ncbi:UDP-Glycosyltransferase/glycogen phosphorylase [Basidiobolus meristosporus CBS 931.73]|uniref:UDP-Glycosyltransferase/glycogen phosphorylase n=1 Tax=Basidiobolus meristosporus CBS 931.73 TaxID=1314790 RepID=A0A1Y1YUJ8_9FUNG|nr:UDP-Glycosyltransferase/glycogen phosphorylase [Basidiobolus meristosporus CBS 931.73]|eukprot:ORY01235.1 UDP-Glycosyltransferase/glycogen phosphorylase [Basidiobolus meristosporus CBS 931.73]
MKITLLILPSFISLATGQVSFNETWRQPGKIIISSHYGGYSHAKPIFQVASALERRGYEVGFASFTPFLDLANPWGMRKIPMGDGPLTVEEIKEASKRLISDPHMDIMKVVAIMWHTAYDYSYQQLKRIFAEEKPNFVMCDVFNFGCIDAASDLNIPFSVQVASLCLLYSISDTVINSLDIGSVTTDFGVVGRFNRNFKRRLEYLWKNWHFTQIANQERVKSGSVVRQEPGFNNFDKGVIFVNSFFGIDQPKNLPPNVHLVGPLLSFEYPPLTPELQSFLDSRQRVTYIAFGTNVRLDRAKITKILTSVLQLLDDKAVDGVIWPLSVSAIEEFPEEIHVNNATIQVEQILKNLHENIRILDFAPQFSVLSHPNTVLFVSHGGLDSANEALVTGTRVLSLPVFGDQFYNVANLKIAGVTIPMDINTFSIPEMIEKAKLLLEDKGGYFARNVHRMQLLAQINSKRIQHAADIAEQMIYAGNTDDPMKNIHQTLESRLSLWLRYDLDIYIILISISTMLSYGFFRLAQVAFEAVISFSPSAKVKKL